MSNQPYCKMQVKIDKLLIKVQSLPLTEFSYYITLLIACINNEKHKEVYIEIINKSDALVEELNQLYSKSLSTAGMKNKSLESVLKALNNLVNETNKYAPSK